MFNEILSFKTSKMVFSLFLFFGMQGGLFASSALEMEERNDKGVLSSQQLKTLQEVIGSHLMGDLKTAKTLAQVSKEFHKVLCNEQLPYHINIKHKKDLTNFCNNRPEKLPCIGYLLLEKMSLDSSDTALLGNVMYAIRFLTIVECQITDNALKGFAQFLNRSSCHLVGLNLSDNRVNPWALGPLTQALQKNTTVQLLKLSKNENSANANTQGDINTDFWIEVLGETLLSNRVLRSVDVSYNNLDDQGVQRIIGGLFLNKTLLKLNASWNNITGNSIEGFISMLENNKRIYALHLAGNKLTDNEVLQLVTTMAGHPTFNELNIASNNLTKDIEEFIFTTYCTDNKRIVLE